MRIAIVLLISLCSRVVSAQPPESWREGRSGQRRTTHIVAILFGGAVYVGSETVGKRAFAPTTCRWCDVPNVDNTVRDAVIWDHPERAGTLSDVGSFLLAPASSVGLTMLAGWGASDYNALRWIDDTLPIIETALVASLVDQAVKFTVARQRPYAHFDTMPGRAPTLDDNLSFYSGHTTHAFGFAVSAGVVASTRHYKLAPVVWASGLLIAGTTGYLRIAADKHYFTDVVVGAAAGTGFGIAIPLLFHSDVLVAPRRDGVAVVGQF